MTVRCPHCKNQFDIADLIRRPGTGGGECPLCNGTVSVTQPYVFLRKVISLLIPFLFLKLIGVEDRIALFMGSIVLWFPAYIFLSMSLLFVLPPGLRPLRQKSSDKPFDSKPYELFGGNRPK